MNFLIKTLTIVAIYSIANFSHAEFNFKNLPWNNSSKVEICKIHYDGFRFKSGAVKSNKYVTYGLVRYGIRAIEVSYPIEMAEALKMDVAINQDLDKADAKLTAFYKENWHQIATLCNL